MTNLLNIPRSNLQPAAAPADKPKAAFWMNIGYEAEVLRDNVPEKVFIGLPFGLPLDTMSRADESSRNAEMRALMGARNALLDQVLEAAKSLKPGEERLVNLQVQIRAVNEAATPIAAADNPFIKPLSL